MFKCRPKLATLALLLIPSFAQSSWLPTLFKRSAPEESALATTPFEEFKQDLNSRVPHIAVAVGTPLALAGGYALYKTNMFLADGAAKMAHKLGHHKQIQEKNLSRAAKIIKYTVFTGLSLAQIAYGAYIARESTLVWQHVQNLGPVDYWRLFNYARGRE